MDYAAAVNEEIKALFAAGADVVQLDEPHMQARPEKARAYAVKAINRALEGVRGTTALHVCFGYAHVVGHEKPNGYSFLAELADCVVPPVYTDSAPPNLDLSILMQLPPKSVWAALPDQGFMLSRTPNVVTRQH